MTRIILLVFFSWVVSSFSAENFYDLSAKKIKGDTLYFSELKGKKLMIVNVASYCGYTYQYAELQNLYKQFGGDKFEIIGFPANNFSNQEPGSDSSILDFCTENYDVTFTMMSKISVKGMDKHPVYQWLTLKSKNGVKDQEVMWNFQKYLVNENGQLVGIYGSQVSPLATEIVEWVSAGTSDVNDRDNVVLEVFPNPTTDFITIQTQPSEGLQPSEGSVVEIYDMLGVKMQTTPSAPQPTLQEGNLRIDVSHLPVGLYYVKIGDRIEKFVKM